MCPPLDHPAAVRVERAWGVPEDRKVLPVRAVLKDNTEMVARLDRAKSC
jgi:hypothetical protein